MDRFYMNLSAEISADKHQERDAQSKVDASRCPFHEKMASYKLDRSANSMKEALILMRDGEIDRQKRELTDDQKGKFLETTDAILNKFVSIAAERAKNGGEKYNSEVLTKALEKLFDLNECPVFRK